MKKLAYVLIAGGFLAGAYFTVVDTEGVAWSGAIPALLVGLVGVAIVQVMARSARGETEVVQANIGQLEQSLARIVENATALDRRKAEVDPYEFRHRIDELFMADLDIFVEGRESIGHAYGLQAYAEVMTSFATGERYLNRCWSASTDGYIDEVQTYIGRAKIQFEDALTQLRSQTPIGRSINLAGQ